MRHWLAWFAFETGSNVRIESWKLELDHGGLPVTLTNRATEMGLARLVIRAHA